MLEIRRTNADDPHFIALIERLDEVLQALNNEKHGFFNSHNLRSSMPYAVVAYLDGEPVGSGALRPKDIGAEVKRMFVDTACRGRGVGAAILVELESWARELGHERTVLETSKKLNSAIGLYRKSGYVVVPNYPPYEDVEESVCMAKELRPGTLLPSGEEGQG